LQNRAEFHHPLDVDLDLAVLRTDRCADVLAASRVGQKLPQCGLVLAQ
jgi:hypothetical protein